MAKDSDGNEIKVGMQVGFKSDIEQYGTVTEINGRNITIENENGFDGGYIGGDTKVVMQAEDCWTD